MNELPPAPVEQQANTEATMELMVHSVKTTIYYELRSARVFTTPPRGGPNVEKLTPSPNVAADRIWQQQYYMEYYRISSITNYY